MTVPCHRSYLWYSWYFEVRDRCCYSIFILLITAWMGVCVLPPTGLWTGPVSQQPPCSPRDQSPLPPGPQNSVAVWFLDPGLFLCHIFSSCVFLLVCSFLTFFSSAQQCSASCGKGTRMRYVSCRDNQGGVAEESACAHLPKPPAREVCSVVACGQWKVLEWTVVRRKALIIIYPVVSNTMCTLSEKENIKQLHLDV